MSTSKLRKKNCFGSIRSLFSFSTAQTEKNSWKNWGKQNWWFDVTNKMNNIMFTLGYYRSCSVIYVCFQKLILGWRTLQNLVIFPSVKTAYFLICHSPNIQWTIRTKLKTSLKFLDSDWKNHTLFTSPFSYVLSWSSGITTQVRSFFFNNW